MRRFWLLLLAITTILVIALPAGAVKPPLSALITASLDGGPMWVHEAGDVIEYSVTVQNKSRAPVDVEVFYADDDDVPQSLPIEIEAKNTYVEKDLFSRTVTSDHIDGCLEDQDCDLFAEVTVRYPDEGPLIAIVETSTLIDPVDECIFLEGIPRFTESGLCIWKPSPPGTWEVSAVPVLESNRPTNLMMTMRDGVPGNWCTLPDGSGGVVQDRWLRDRPDTDPVVLDVFLPGENGDLDDGMCLMGGAGVCTDDDCYFAVGNPESFYLYTTFDGFITVRNTD